MSKVAFVRFLLSKATLFPAFPIINFGMKSLGRLSVKEFRLCSSSLTGSIYTNFWNSAWKICLFLFIDLLTYLFIHSFNRLFILLWTHGNVFSALVYNPVLHYLFCCSNHWLLGTLSFSFCVHIPYFHCVFFMSTF